MSREIRTLPLSLKRRHALKKKIEGNTGNNTERSITSHHDERKVKAKRNCAGVRVCACVYVCAYVRCGLRDIEAMRSREH